MRDAYGWYQCRIDLERGVNPVTVAERMGEPVDYIKEVAADQGWPVTWSGQTAEQSLEAGERFL